MSYINTEPDLELTVQEERIQFRSERKRQKDTARLIWASKPRREPSPKDLEFQTAEEVYPNKATGNLTSFFDSGEDEISSQPNRLIWGDNLLVMQALLAQGYEGQIDLIYIDPPFNTGENFNFPNDVKIGDRNYEREMPMNERLAYSDTWERGIDSFLDMLYPRLQLMKRLLSEDGSIYVHLDLHAGHYVKIIMDEIFGKDNFINEIVWQKIRSSKGQAKSFGNVHDIIFCFSKSNLYKFNKQYKKHDPKRFETHYNNIEENTGRRYQLADFTQSGQGEARRFGDIILSPPNGKHWIWSQEKIDEGMENGLIVFTSGGKPRVKRYLDESKGTPIEDIWTDIFPINSQALESLGYPTQKPESLLERIFYASSNEGDLVADLFCGSGTTAAVSEKLGRRWITSDLSKTAIQVARSRLVNQNAAPFIVQNLGNYQRQLIYLKDVKLKEMYNIVLKLYGAVPRDDWQGFGTKKDEKDTLVYVSEPDRPVTGKKAIELAKNAATADGRGYKRLVILAWDYEYNFEEDFARLKKNIKTKQLAAVEFKVIPSDVYRYLRSTNVGDVSIADKITFYQKPYLRLGEPQVKGMNEDSITTTIKIEQYVILDIPLKDESKRPEIEEMLHNNFPALIDFWTVDWDYDSEVFRSKWQAIRDRKKGEPVPIIADANLKRGKKYTIAVRVVDVFGNDASAIKELDLR
ncbi:MAG: site-specific DNA-methyltransferase [Methanosarcinales archaeon]|nr:site-specific DNA-methyltransferase [Methanosarcinales archaeon]